MSNFVIISYCTLFGAIFVSALVKGKYHFDYLRIIDFNQYGDYPSFFSVFTPKFYNVELQFLVLPFYNRKKELENKQAVKQATKVKRMLIINLLTIFLMFIFIVLLVYNSN